MSARPIRNHKDFPAEKESKPNGTMSGDTQGGFNITNGPLPAKDNRFWRSTGLAGGIGIMSVKG